MLSFANFGMFSPPFNISCHKISSISPDFSRTYFQDPLLLVKKVFILGIFFLLYSAPKCLLL